MKDVFSSSFAYDIFQQKYAAFPGETWAQRCESVIRNVCRDLLPSDIQTKLYHYMYARKWIPAGRYLYGAGRELHNVTNCYAYSFKDSREGWAKGLHDAASILMLGGGFGASYSEVRGEGSLIARTGSKASGPLPLMHMVNETARGIISGGDRRGACYAGLSVNHPDVLKFMAMKNWSDDLKTLKAKDPLFPMPMEYTNISIEYDPYELHHNLVHQEIFRKNLIQACQTAEPGFTFVHKNQRLRNPCQPAFASVLTPEGIKTFADIDVGSTIWGGNSWVKVVRKWSTGIKKVRRYRTTAGEFIGTENHRVIQRGERIEAKDATGIDASVGNPKGLTAMNPQDIMDGLVLGDGTVHKASNNLVYLCVGEKDQDYFKSEIRDLFRQDRRNAFRYGWEITTTITPDELPRTWDRKVPERFYRGTPSVMRGFLRGLFTANGGVTAGRVTFKTSSKILAYQVLEMLSALGIVGSLATNKPTKIKHRNGTYTSKESYNINLYKSSKVFMELIGFIQDYKTAAVINERLVSYIKTPKLVNIEDLGEHEVFDITVDHADHTYWTGGCLVSNCAEFVTEESGDSCNLASVFISRIVSKEELADIVSVVIPFLMCGRLYTDMPTEEIRQTGLRNNRIGLGFSGVADWLIQRNLPYEENPELTDWLETWKNTSISAAEEWADKLNLNYPKGIRAIAPAGSIGILAETTTSIEPVYAKAYKRRYRKEGKWFYQYVIDGAVKRWTELGIPDRNIFDAGDLTFEQRVKFLAYIQDYVDMGVSITCNLPEWGTPGNHPDEIDDKVKILMAYAPWLQGFTCYPDGARGLQPLTRTDISTAKKKEGVAYEEREHVCNGGTCGV